MLTVNIPYLNEATLGRWEKISRTKHEGIQFFPLVKKNLFEAFLYGF